MIVSKIRLSELLFILNNLKKETEFIDISADKDNTLRIRIYKPFNTSEEDDEDFTDLNQAV